MSDKEKGLPLRTPVPPQRILASTKVKSPNEKSTAPGQNKPAPPQRVLLKVQEPRTEVKKTPAPPQRCVMKVPMTCGSKAASKVVTPPRGVEFSKGSPGTSVREKKIRTVSKTCISKFPRTDNLSPAKNFNRIRHDFDLAGTKKTLTFDDDDSDEDYKASTMKTLKAIHRKTSSSSQAVVKNFTWSERRFASKPSQNMTSSSSYDKISLAAMKHGAATQKLPVVREAQKRQFISKLPLVEIKNNISKVHSSKGTNNDENSRWCKDEVIKQCIGSLNEISNSPCGSLDLKSEVASILEIEEHGSNKYVKILGQLLNSLKKVKEERERLSKVESVISTLYCYFASNVLEGSSSSPRSPASTEFEKGDSVEAKIRRIISEESTNPAGEFDVCDEECVKTDDSACEDIVIDDDEAGCACSGSGSSYAENKTDASNCDADTKFPDGRDSVSETEDAKVGPSDCLDMDLQTSYLKSSTDKVQINDNSMLDASIIIRLLEGDQGHSDSQFDERGFNPMARLLCDGDDNHFVPINREDSTFDESMHQ